MQTINDLGTKTLETNRLILRKFTKEDAEGMYNNWATDKECCKYLSWEIHKNIEETKEILNKWIEQYNDNSYNWVVELKETKEIIGSISIVKNHKKDLYCEIGYCYGSKYWNKGYATEALKRVIDFFIDECNLHLVEAYHISGNPASGRVMQKAGMHKDAVLRDRRINKYTNELNDIIIYSITKSEWKNNGKIKVS